MVRSHDHEIESRTTKVACEDTDWYIKLSPGLQTVIFQFFDVKLAQTSSIATTVASWSAKWSKMAEGDWESRFKEYDSFKIVEFSK